MRIHLALLTTTVLAGALAAADAAPPTSPAILDVRGSSETGEGRLRGDLRDVVREAAPTELIPISIVLRDQASPAVLDDAAAVGRKDERRAAVVTALKSAAAASNGDLLDLLEEEQGRGAVGSRIRPLWIVNVISTSATPEAIQRIAAREDVAYVNWDRPLANEVFPAEPAGGGGGATQGIGGGEIECGVELMGAPSVWSDFGITGQGVVVGVIDTGMCHTHPDLANQIWSNADETPGNGSDDDANGYVDDIRGWNFRDDTSDTTDDNSHGTHVSGTVGGDGSNGTTTGMAPGVSIMILKFWNNFSGESVVWEAMQYAVDNDADVITASIGWPHNQGPDRVSWRMSCENAIAAGVVVIYAAGNEGEFSPPFDNVRTPGDVPDVITVGATDCAENIAGFSSRGPVTWQDVAPYNDWPYPPGKTKPSISAPGVDTQSTSNNCSGYLPLSGTSMATPHVAGAVALMLEANPCLDHFDVKAILMSSSLDLGTPGMDNTFGAGRVDAYAAVVAAMNATSDPDFDDDGDVDFSDLLTLLAEWGDCPDPPADCPADVDCDGTVGFADLLSLLAAWS